MRSRNHREDIAKLLMNTTRLAILLVLATAEKALTLSNLERILGLPKQTIHTHLEYMVKAGIVTRRIVFNSRPRPVYEITWDRVNDILLALRSIKSNIDQLLETLRDKG